MVHVSLVAPEAIYMPRVTPFLIVIFTWVQKIGTWKP